MALTIYAPREDAALRLICFPPAGASASTLASWSAALPSSIEVAAVEYPGRGARRGEPPAVRLHALVAGLFPVLRTALAKPFAVIGHSMGAFVAFELLRQLERHGGPTALALFAAGCRGPSLAPRKAPIYEWPDAELLEEIRKLNGTPREILEDRHFASVFLPVLRADFEVADTYIYRPGALLKCPVYAYGGEDDAETLPSELPAWAQETRAPLVIRMYTGDHFFLTQARDAVLRDLADDLQRLAGVAGPHPGVGMAWH